LRVSEIHVPPTIDITAPAVQVAQHTTEVCTTLPPKDGLTLATTKLETNPTVQENPVASSQPNGMDRFKDLLEVLSALAAEGKHRPLRSKVELLVNQRLPSVYDKSGCTNWTDYASQAANTGLVLLGRTRSSSWIAVREPITSPIAVPTSDSTD
jgi:hypothetical protein